MKKTSLINSLLLLPIAGVILFIILYYVATLYYPGGNFEDTTAKGFSWKHNFWCHLLASKAVNGEPNLSRPWGIAAMGILGISVVLFIILIPYKLDFSGRTRTIIQASGVVSILIFLILLSPFHDEAINAGSFFAGIALLGILAGMLRSGKKFLFIHGIISILLSILNFTIYYSRVEIYYLPIVQKVTFAVFLLWFMNSCIQMRKVHAESITS